MDPSSPNANSIIWTHTSLEINIKFKTKEKLLLMKIGTANHVITRQIQNSNIPFKSQVNIPWNTPVGLPKAFRRKTNWKYWIKYIKPIWCPQHSKILECIDISFQSYVQESCKDLFMVAANTIRLVKSITAANKANHESFYRQFLQYCAQKLCKGANASGLYYIVFTFLTWTLF